MLKARDQGARNGAVDGPSEGSGSNGRIDGCYKRWIQKQWKDRWIVQALDQGAVEGARLMVQAMDQGARNGTMDDAGLDQEQWTERWLLQAIDCHFMYLGLQIIINYCY